MVSLRQTSSLLEPDAPMWAQRFAQRLDKRYLLLWPRSPVRFWNVTKANLPDPTDWPNSMLYVSDVKKLAISDGTTWRDAMGNAI